MRVFMDTGADPASFMAIRTRAMNSVTTSVFFVLESTAKSTSHVDSECTHSTRRPWYLSS